MKLIGLFAISFIVSHSILYGQDADTVIIWLSVSGSPGSTGGGGNSSNCSSTNSLSASLVESGSRTLIGSIGASNGSYNGQNASIYRGKLAHGWQGLASGYGSFTWKANYYGATCPSNQSGSITDRQLTYDASKVHQSFEFRDPNWVDDYYTGYKFAVTVDIYKAVKTPFAAPIVCGNTTVQLSVTDDATYFDWYVWDGNSTTSAKIFRANAGKSITATVDELSNPEFGFKTSKYHPRYIRVVAKGWLGRRTSTNCRVKFDAPPAAMSVRSENPACFNQDGKLYFSVTKPSGSLVTDYVVKLWDGVKQQTFKQFSTSSTHTDYFITNTTGSSRKDFEIEVVNNTNTATYGTCSIKKPTSLHNPDSVRVNFAKTTPLCPGASNGSVTANPVGGSGTYNIYRWASPLTATTKTVNNLAAGTYTVTVTDSKGCISKATRTTLSDPSTIAVSVTPTQRGAGYEVTCHNKSDGQVTVSASGGAGNYQYKMGSGTYGSGNVFTSLAPGTYTFYVKDQHQCTQHQMITLDAPPPIDFEIYNSQAIHCPGKSTGQLSVINTKNIIGTPRYNWSSGETTATISNKKAGSYTLTITDGQGCSAQKSYALSDPAFYTVSIAPTLNSSGQPISCYQGSDGQLTATLKNTNNLVVTASKYEWFKDLAKLPSETNPVRNLSAGSYKVRATYNTDCVVESSPLSLQHPTQIVPNIIVSQTIRCYGDADGTLLASATGGTGNYTYAWNNAANTKTAMLTDRAGTYTVTIKDTNGCSTTAQKQLVQPPRLMATIQVASAINCWGESGQLNASATGGTFDMVNGIPNYTYSWINQTDNTKIITKKAGTYTVSVKDKNSCVATASGTLTDPPKLQVSIATLSEISCYGYNNGQLRATATGGKLNVNSAYRYFWNGSASSSQTLTAGAGTHTVVVRDDNNCTATISKQLVNPAPVSPSVTALLSHNGAQISCPGAQDGILTASAIGGKSPYTYNWNNPANSTTAQLTAKAGTYTVKVTDQNNCTAEASGTLKDPPPINASIQILSRNLCNGYSQIHLKANHTGGTGDVTYSWSTAATTQTVSNLRAGTYTVTISDHNECSESETITIVDPAPLRASVTSLAKYSGFDIKCHNTSDAKLKASATGGNGQYRYVWDGNTNLTDSVRTNLPGGIYSVIVTDKNGCTASASYTTVNPPPITASIKTFTPFNGQAISCYNASDGRIEAQAAGGTSSYTYSWNTGSTSRDINGLGHGTYTVVARDQNNCSASSQVSLPNPAQVAATIQIQSSYNGSPISCYNAADGKLNASATGGTNVFTYSWSNGKTTQAIEHLNAGNYVVTAKDNNGCSDTEQVVIAAPELVTARIDVKSDYHGQAISCFDSLDATLLASASGGVGGFIYQWENGVNDAVLANIGAGVYRVTATDENGCIAKQLIELLNPLPVQVRINVLSDFHGFPISCYGLNDGILEALATGGTGNFKYQWNTNHISARIENIPSGHFSVQAEDENGCFVRDTIFVHQPDEINVQINVLTDFNGYPLSCYGSADGALFANASGGTYNYQYNWNTGDTTHAISDLPAANYLVSVVDDNGCKEQVDTTLRHPEPVIAEISDRSFFNGYGTSCNESTDGYLEINATGGTGSFFYFLNDSLRFDNLFQDLSAGEYRVKVADANGCTDSLSTEILAPPLLKLRSEKIDHVTCFDHKNGGIFLDLEGGVEPYQAKLIDEFDWGDSTVLDSLAAGLYTVLFRDTNGCVDSLSTEITSPTALQVDFQTLPALCDNPTGHASAVVTGGSGPYSFDWFNSSNQIISSTNKIEEQLSGVFTFRAKDANECILEQSINIVGVDGPEIRHTALVPPTCYDAMNGEATIEILKGTAPFSIHWSTSDTSLVASNLSRGTYHVEVTDANGCTNSSEIQIVAPPLLQVKLVEEPRHITCYNICDGKIHVAGEGGTGTYLYDWGHETTPLITNLCAGEYVVKVTDSNNCTASKRIELIQPPSLSLQLTSIKNPSCFRSCDGLLEIKPLGGNGDYTTSWNNGMKTTRPTGLCAGTYAVKVTDKKLCTVEKSFVLSDPKPLNLELVDQVAPRCNSNCDGLIEVKASGGSGTYQYLWSNGSRYALATSLCSGSHTVTVKDLQNCKVEKSYTLSQPEVLSLSTILQNEPTCYQGCNGRIEVKAMGGNGSYRYAWTSGSRSSFAASLCEGQYSVSVTDSKSCAIKQAFDLEDPEPVAIELISKTFSQCLGNCDGRIEVNAIGGTGNYSYLWSSGDRRPVADALCPGTHSLVVSDENKCSTSTVFKIEHPLLLKAQLVRNSMPDCFGGCNGMLEATVSGGSGTYTIDWSNGDTDLRLDGICAGEYVLNVEDAGGCTTSSVFSLEQPDQIELQLVDSKPTSCYGTCDGELEVIASGGTGEYNYFWDGMPGTVVSNNLCEGYTLISVTDKNNCEAIDRFYIEQPVPIQAEAVEILVPSCNQSKDGSIQIIATGGHAPYRYKWNTGGTRHIVSALAAGTYQVQVTDNNECQVEELFKLSQPDDIEISTRLIDEPSCNDSCDGAIQIFANGGNGDFTYRWSSGAASEDAKGLCAGEHTIVVTDHKGCEAEKTMILTAPQPLQLLLAQSNLPSCYGNCDGALILESDGGTAPYHLVTDFGHYVNIIPDLCANDYSVTLVDAQGCSISKTFTLAQPPVLQLDLGGSALLCREQSYILDTGGPWFSCIWQSSDGFSERTFAVTLTSPGLYWVEVQDFSGCIAADTFLLESSENLVRANFIMAAEASVGDTVVIADISWPVPENTYFTFPSELTVLSQSADMIEGAFQQPGQFAVTLTSTVAQCADSLTKTITILENSSLSEQARLGYEDFLKTFDVFSNPNDGSFDVTIEFSEESDILLSVWAVPSGYMHGKLQSPPKCFFKQHIDLRPLPSGYYILRLDHKKGKEYVRFIVH